MNKYRFPWIIYTITLIVIISLGKHDFKLCPIFYPNNSVDNEKCICDTSKYFFYFSTGKRYPIKRKRLVNATRAHGIFSDLYSVGTKVYNI